MAARRQKDYPCHHYERRLVSEVQGDGGFQVRQSLAETIRQSCQSRICIRMVKFCRST